MKIKNILMDLLWCPLSPVFWVGLVLGKFFDRVECGRLERLEQAKRAAEMVEWRRITKLAAIAVIEIEGKHNPELDAVCKRFDDTLSVAIENHHDDTNARVNQARSEMDQLISENGPALMEYLAPLKTIVPMFDTCPFPIPNHLFRTAYRLFRKEEE